MSCGAEWQRIRSGAAAESDQRLHSVPRFARVGFRFLERAPQPDCPKETRSGSMMWKSSGGVAQTFCSFVTRSSLLS